MNKASTGLTAFLLLCMSGSCAAAAANTLSSSDNTCFNVLPLFLGSDCSHSATRYPAMETWQGPSFAAGYYAYNSIKDNPALNGIQPDGQDFLPAPNDGKLSVPLSWSLAIQDNGTPSDGADDMISGTFSFGAADRWSWTGNGDSAMERWASWNHTLAPTAVNFAVVLPGGGFEYVIGSRGKPTPLVAAADANDRFPSENVPAALGSPTFWSPDGANLPLAERIGIERSPGFGNTDGSGGVSLQPNVGGQTTATMTDYECIDAFGDNDCLTSPFLIGASTIVGNTGTPAPGFTNLIMVLTVGPDGNLIDGEAFWTREFITRAGPAIGDDPTNPSLWVTPNSWVGGRFTMSAVPAPSAAWLIAPAVGLLVPRMKRRTPNSPVSDGVHLT